MNRSRFLIVLTSLCWGGCYFGDAVYQRAGIVSDETGTPIEGATVRMEAAGRSEVPREPKSGTRKHT
jgi:hypothetical protein